VPPGPHDASRKVMPGGRSEPVWPSVVDHPAGLRGLIAGRILDGLGKRSIDAPTIDILSAKLCRYRGQPFSQADSSAHRRFGGTGLGLAISKRLAGMLEATLLYQAIWGKEARSL
jgi:hypothetical protein